MNNAQAVMLVLQYLQKRGIQNVNTDDIKITWNCYILGNQKYMISYLPTKLYFEITYNKEKNEVYIDEYTKLNNVCVNLNNVQ